MENNLRILKTGAEIAGFPFNGASKESCSYSWILPIVVFGIGAIVYYHMITNNDLFSARGGNPEDRHKRGETDE